MNPTSPNDFPFELHAAGGGGFVSFDTGDIVALPLLALEKATLRGTGGREIVLEFPGCCIQIEGEGLAEPFDHLLAGRIKILRLGHHEGCRVERLCLSDA